MKREILTQPLSKEQFRDEFHHFIEFFATKGVTTCQVLFGFAWGMEYYPGNEWAEESIPLVGLIQKVEEVEASGLGALGGDDLFIKVPGMEFQFCHESDVHIFFADNDPDIESFFQRWKVLGFKPVEWLKEGERSARRKIRDA